MGNELAKALKRKTDAQFRVTSEDQAPGVVETPSGQVVVNDPSAYMVPYVSGKNVSIGNSGSNKVINAIMNILAGDNVSVSAPDENGAVRISASIGGKSIDLTGLTDGYVLTYDSLTDTIMLKPAAGSISQATDTVLGGVKAAERTTESSEVKIDATTGKLYAPSPDQAANGLPAGGSAGQVLSKVDGTDFNAEWVDISGGGGTTFYANTIDAPPLVAHANDDEFSTITLDEKWSWVNQGTSTVQIVSGKVILDCAPATDNVRGIIQSAPVGDFTLTAKLNQNVREVNYSAWGICLYNSANSRFVTIGKGARNGVRSMMVQRVSETTWNADLVLNNGIGGVDVYVRIVKVGTMLKFYYSLDGTCWLWVADESIATHLVAVTGIGLAFFRNNSTASEKMFGVCDWFRVTEP